MVFTKYHEIFELNSKFYLFNTNNGALIEFDNLKTLNEYTNDNFQALSDEDKSILLEQEFLVDEDFDVKQHLCNKLNYNLSKYSLNKDEVKIDFALTDGCNFCCPYCFEKENLNCAKLDSSHLLKTSEKLFYYITQLVEKFHVKKVKIVYYGGEPTLEKKFIAEFSKKVKDYLHKHGCEYRYNIITNGYLIDEQFLKSLTYEDCEFIQITIDGEKDFHNSRRTNKAKINTFDKIIENINLCAQLQFKTVIRLNIDKTNIESEKKFLDNIDRLFNKDFLGKYIFVDLARVFGTDNSYDLVEFEEIRKLLVKKCRKYSLLNEGLKAKSVSTFCIAESISRDIVIDNKGNLYRCWNNVFDNNCRINTLDDLINNQFDPYDKTDITLDFVEDLSLNCINKGKCFKCKFIKYCQGLCPRIRKNIIEKIDKDIYTEDLCKEIIKKRIFSIIEGVVKEND